MKKTTKPPTKKSTTKTPAAKKSPAKPKRKAQGHSELLEIVAQLAAITVKLGDTVERLAALVPPVEIRTDEVVVASVAPEECPPETGPDIVDPTGEE
jgi:hypothetical protein